MNETDQIQLGPCTNVQGSHSTWKTLANKGTSGNMEF